MDAPATRQALNRTPSDDLSRSAVAAIVGRRRDRLIIRGVVQGREGRVDNAASIAISERRAGDQLYFLSNALKHLPVGLEEVSDGVWSLFFCHVLLARLDERTHTLIRG